MTFLEKLAQAVARNNSLLCIGLDPDPRKLPGRTRTEENPVLYFNRRIIEATSDLVCAYKPNLAFYGALGPEGWSTLRATLAHVPPSIPIVIDAKVGDIGHSAEKYATMFFRELGADAVTANPYMGGDAVAPLLQYADKGVFLLCLTSNKGARDFEMLPLRDRPLYEHVALKAVSWNRKGNCGLVVGATQSETMGGIRSLAPDLPILVPGVGAQGGDLKTAVSCGQDEAGGGVLINASRSVLYAGQGDDFAMVARQAASRLRDEINRCRTRVGEGLATTRMGATG
jgi:orotidine 5'-phosphate decarboxylase subfamily 2